VLVQVVPVRTVLLLREWVWARAWALMEKRRVMVVVVVVGRGPWLREEQRLRACRYHPHSHSRSRVRWWVRVGVGMVKRTKKLASWGAALWGPAPCGAHCSAM